MADAGFLTPGTATAAQRKEPSPASTEFGRALVQALLGELSKGGFAPQSFADFVRAGGQRKGLPAMDVTKLAKVLQGDQPFTSVTRTKTKPAQAPLLSDLLTTALVANAIFGNKDQGGLMRGIDLLRGLSGSGGVGTPAGEGLFADRGLLGFGEPSAEFGGTSLADFNIGGYSPQEFSFSSPDSSDSLLNYFLTQ